MRRVYPGVRFNKYAILGDDVVIADDRVASAYSALISGLCVNISVGKSLTSPSGCCEFAKRFIIRNMRVDVSPVSIKKILAASSPLGWYNLILTLPRPLRWSTELRLMGVGFKAASRHIHSPNKKRFVIRLRIMKIHSQLATLSYEMSLCTSLGFIVLPEVIGRIVYDLLEKYIPKDPELPSDDTFEHPEAMDFNEYTILPNWVKQYLEYLKWNCLLRMKPVVTLDDFKNIPVYISSCARPGLVMDEFHIQVRYGITFRIYDMVIKYSKAKRPRLFPFVSSCESFDVIYLGPLSKGLNDGHQS